MAVVLAVACSGCATGLTGSPRSIAGTEATLWGGFVSTTGGDGGNVTYWVEWGTTTAYGAESTHRTWQFSVEPNQPQTVVIGIDGLQRDTTYHYRFCAEDDQQQGGPGCGGDRTFTTPNVDCGDVITNDLVLSGELTCSETGLVIGADGVDIDLNHNSILGPEGRPPRETSGLGIDNTGGFDDVTIHDGALARLGNAVHLRDASFNTIRNVFMGQGNQSVTIEGGESNTIRSSTMTGTLFGDGLSANNSDGLVVADSSGDQWVISGSQARIVRNDIGTCFQFHNSLRIGGNQNRIADNVIGSCAQGALVLTGGAGNELIGNEVSSPSPSDPAPDLGADGIRVEPFTALTLLQGNFVHGNGDDGIDVRASSARLEDNRADDNGDFGIDAIAGVTDGGGNTASGNGNPLQCRNVFCQ